MRKRVASIWAPLSALPRREVGKSNIHWDFSNTNCEQPISIRECFWEFSAIYFLLPHPRPNRTRETCRTRGTERLRFLPKFTQLADWQSRTQILNLLVAHALSNESFSQCPYIFTKSCPQKLYFELGAKQKKKKWERGERKREGGREKEGKEEMEGQRRTQHHSL